MENTIKVNVKDVYGTRKVYPICQTGQLFAQLAGTTTLTDKTRRLIEQLGYTFEVATPTLGAQS